MPAIALENAPIWLNATAFLGAAAVVWFAGVRLTRALDQITLKTGLGEAFVGMLLLGGITSLPEVANVLSASSQGAPGLAINNLLGSAAINVVLLAGADAVIGREALTSVVAKPATMMMAALCMLVLGFVAVAVSTGDVAVFGVGIWSCAIFMLSLGAFGLAVGYGRRAPWVLKDGGAEADEAGEKADGRSLRKLIATSVVTGLLIFCAGYALSQLGDALAAQTNLGAGFVGFLLVGFATSMPELSSISAALRLRRYEMAFGQVLGTNFINLSLFLLADVVYPGGPVINELGSFEVISALIGLILIGVFQVGLLERKNPVLFRAGYDSIVVMALFIGGVGLLYGAR